MSSNWRTIAGSWRGIVRGRFDVSFDSHRWFGGVNVTICGNRAIFRSKQITKELDLNIERNFFVLFEEFSALFELNTEHRSALFGEQVEPEG